MEYKGAYGKTVMVKVDHDLNGLCMDRRTPHVVSFYMDNDAAVLGIYPLLDGGYDKEDILSTQPVQHVVYAEDLEEINA